jgi:hypothetical protein
VTEKLVWHVVKEFAAKIGVSKLAPQISVEVALGFVAPPVANWSRFNFYLGTFPFKNERYLGCTQRIASAVNDRIGIEPKD